MEPCEEGERETGRVSSCLSTRNGLALNHRGLSECSSRGPSPQVSEAWFSLGKLLHGWALVGPAGGVGTGAEPGISWSRREVPSREQGNMLETLTV